VRKLLTLYYDYRISKNQEYLDSLNKERDTTIDKLKAATKYNSTQELIDKYSSKPASPKQQPGDGKKRVPSGQQGQGPQQQRMFVQPPATANINRGPVPKPGTPVQQPPGPSPKQNLPQLPPQPLPPSPGMPPSAEFAPNAFSSSTTPLSAPAFGESRWYDRILDALLGEDETSSKNRFALICSQCRLVNGQAPPGAKSLEDVGIWRCSGCGAMNGEESEATKLVKHVAQVVKSEPSEPEVGEEFAPSGSEEASEDSPSPEDEAPARSTRSKSKGRKGKKKT
jgi:endoplasmic reticulum junction formation protein lunapark